MSTAHVINSEGGGAAALAGRDADRPARRARTVRCRDAAGRVPRRSGATRRIRRSSSSSRRPITAAVRSGRSEQLDRVAEAAHAHGLATHMDGARLLNAMVAAGIAPDRMAAGMDSVWLDFTKGLGAPLGAVLCGSADFIDAAWRWKQRWAARCGRPASAPPPVSTRSTTMSIAWRRITPMRGTSPRAWPRSPASR